MGGERIVSLLRRRELMAKAGESFPEQEIGVELIPQIKTGYVVDTTDGTLTANSSGRYCDYIPVYPGRSYKCAKYNNRTGYLARYDKDKNFVSGESVANSSSYITVIPSTENGYRYIRWSGTSGAGGPLSVKRTA